MTWFFIIFICISTLLCNLLYNVVDDFIWPLLLNVIWIWIKNLLVSYVQFIKRYVKLTSYVFHPYWIKFLRSSFAGLIFEFITPEGFPFVSSSSVKRQLTSCKAHFVASVCNLVTCSFFLFTFCPPMST